MKLIGLVRLGADAQLRYTTTGKPVASLSGAFSFGQKEDGKRPTQWVELTLWGDRAIKLEEYLTKGQQLLIVASDPHVERYQKSDGTPAFRFRATVDDLEFAGGARDGQASEEQAHAPASASARPAASAPAKRASATPPDPMDDDIPF